MKRYSYFKRNLICIYFKKKKSFKVGLMVFGYYRILKFLIKFKWVVLFDRIIVECRKYEWLRGSLI